MRYISCAILIAALTGCGEEARIAQPPEAPAVRTPGAQYDIVKLPSLGGTSRGMSINNEGNGCWLVPDWRRFARTRPGGSTDQSSTSVRSAGLTVPCHGRARIAVA